MRKFLSSGVEDFDRFFRLEINLRHISFFASQILHRLLIFPGFKPESALFYYQKLSFETKIIVRS